MPGLKRSLTFLNRTPLGVLGAQDLVLDALGLGREDAEESENLSVVLLGAQDCETLILEAQETETSSLVLVVEDMT